MLQLSNLSTCARWRVPFAVLLIACTAVGASGRGEVGPQPSAGIAGAQAIKVLDGRYVHNVGELQMNVTNWGVLGSFPGAGWDMSEVPSAQWPAGSGVEYLFAAGLWLGGTVAGIPRVTTAYPELELHPGEEDFATLYRSRQGTPHGERLPSPRADDDEDGLIDEDPINGLDDDGDGRIDEDFAATGNQMFRCTFRDDNPTTLSDSPDHQPMNVKVIQETYQWEHDLVDDFVGIEYTIINEGREAINGFLAGFFADPDIGSRQVASNYRDDAVDFVSQSLCVYRYPYNLFYRLQMAIAYDKDGDVDSSNPAPGHLGIVLLGHTTDPFGMLASPFASMRSVNHFGGLIPFGEGGEPINDEQRYELMSGFGFDPANDVENDYRTLVSAGPFRFLPADTVKLQFGLVIGGSREELIDNALEMLFTFDGLWYDADNDEETGVDCKETLIYDPTQSLIWLNPCNPLEPGIIVPRGSKLWVNADCQTENIVMGFCENVLTWCTGVEGRETKVPWLFESPPVPPNLRVWPAEEHNVLFWDNLSETIPDLKRGDYDFEGYMIWRADDWDRPFGTSEANGPAGNLWSLIDEYDIDNGLGYDIGLQGIRYVPNIDANLVAYYETVLMERPDLESALDHLPPIGYSIAQADTAINVVKHRLGMPGGRTYYTYADEYTTTGMHYFYSVTAKDHVPLYDSHDTLTGFIRGVTGGPSTNFVYTVPQTASQPRWSYEEEQVYVVPNPATSESMAPWRLNPNNSDPSGLKIEFHHLPAERSTVRIFTLTGDHVKTLVHDPRPGLALGDYESTGTLSWDLISRNGQDIASGVYLFTVETPGFPKKTGKFVVIR